MKEYKGVVAELKDRLRQALDIRGMKAVELCERTGIPQGAVSYYLAGKSKPKADRIYIISQALDINEAWLLGYDVPMARTTESKKNDQLSLLIARLRRDEKLFGLVVKLAAADDAQLDLIDKLVSGLK